MVVQLVVLLAFVGLTILSVKRFHPPTGERCRSRARRLIGNGLNGSIQFVAKGNLT